MGRHIHWDGYAHKVVLAKFPLEDILPMIGKGNPRKTFVTDLGVFDVKMSSNRLECLKRNQSCVRCGKTGSLFRLETIVKSSRHLPGCFIEECPWCSMHHPIKRFDTPHLNLYHIADDGRMFMMTQDHIIPKSKGGSDDLSNLQTMCDVCNANKANQLDEELHPETWAKNLHKENKMKIWHLSPIDVDSFVGKFPSRKEGQTWAAVVVAPNETSAREVAAEAGGNAWLDKNQTRCEEIVPSEFVVPALILDEVPW